MSLTVLNDIHLGVQRCAGTTPASAQALRQWQMGQLAGFLHSLPEDEGVLINGDLFDGYSVPLSVVAEFVELARRWLFDGAQRRRRLYLSRGNHDISRDSSNLSSFDFACQILRMLDPVRVQVITEPRAFDFGYVVPHAPNQDIFNTWLEDVPEGVRVFLHANFDNNFAVMSDHSLNVSYQQAEHLIERKGCTLVFAHEHQARGAFAGRLIVTGNQWPTSIADCLGNPDGVKSCLRVLDKRTEELDPTWDAANTFAHVSWEAIEDFLGDGGMCDYQFIRVEGEATAAQAAEVVNAIARLRRDHSAFVISNAVEIEGHKLDEGVESTVEAVQAFNPLDLVFELLTEPQGEKVRKLLENSHA